MYFVGAYWSEIIVHTVPLICARLRDKCIKPDVEFPVFEIVFCEVLIMLEIKVFL